MTPLQLAASLPVPVEDGARCTAYVGEQDAHWRVYFGRNGGRHREWAGPTFPLNRAGSRAACDLASLLNGRAPRGPLAPTTRVPETRDVPDPAGPGAPLPPGGGDRSQVGGGWPSLAVADRPTLGLVP